LAMIFCPETPRWLIVKGRVSQAEHSLRRLRGSRFAEDLLQEELEEIRQTTVLEQELAQSGEWRDMFRGNDLHRTMTALGCTLCHSASGINFLVGYATYFFQIAGIPTNLAFQYSIILQCVAAFSAAVGVVLNRYLGRRIIMISGVSLCSASLFIVAGAYLGSAGNSAAGNTMVAFTNIYLAGYSYSIGPVSWVIAGEVPSNRLRSQTLGFAMGIQFLFAWLCTFTLPYYFQPAHLGWGPKIGFLWGSICLIMLVWIIFYLPDLKGRSLEQIDFLFINRVPAWRMNKYQIPELVVEDLVEKKEGVQHIVHDEHVHTALSE